MVKPGIETNQNCHLTEKKIGHLSNAKIPQMADASGGFLLYNWVQIALRWMI